MGGVSPGVAGAATERPLEGVAEDPAGRGIQKTPTRVSGRDYKGGAGAVARGRLPPFLIYKKTRAKISLDSRL